MQKKYKQADKQLNLVYQTVIKENSNDIYFISNLKISQRIWFQFRVAKIKVMYPDKILLNFGSIFSVYWYSYLEELMIERTKKLRQLQDGIQEGELCTGSI